MSALPPKADIWATRNNVRSVLEAVLAEFHRGFPIFVKMVRMKINLLGNTMRQFAILVAVVALSAIPAKAAAAWQEYVFPNDRFAIQFPATSVMENTPYETRLATGLSANVYSLEYENILYRATVVDLTGRIEKGANFIGEAAYNLMREGDVIFNDFPRVGNRVNATFGIGMVVDTEDGRRVRASFYIANGRFYRFDAIVLPARGDKDQAVPSRFDQTLRFNVEGP